MVLQDAYAAAMSRNAGLVTDREQQRLRDARVAVVGVGGDGGLVAERLARLGVGAMRLIDPGLFEAENLNRQYGSATSTLHVNKARAVASNLKDIAPWLDIEVLEVGASSANAASLVSGCDLIIDESEFSEPGVGIAVCDAAHAEGAAVLTGANVGFGANVLAFSPRGISFGRYMGSGPHEGPEAIEACIRALCPRVPQYIDAALLERIANGEADVPALSQSVAAVAAVVTNEAFNYLTQRRDLVWAPRYIAIDLARRSMRVRHASRFGFYWSVLTLRLRSSARSAR